LTGDILDDCFATYRILAARLETLPAYTVPGEAEAIAAWKRGAPRPERSLRTDEYLREIAGDVLAGRERMRVRVADHPLSDYIRWELAGYAENAAAGEHTLIAVRRGGTPRAERDLEQVSRDFWGFDLGTEDERVVLLDYDHDGRFEGAHEATATDAAWCRKMWRAALSHAVPLNEYVAAQAKGVAAA
jgi:hypothetical protein